MLTDLDGGLGALRDASAELAADLRARALAVDADPADMAPHLDSPAFAFIRAVTTPVRYADPPLRIGGRTVDTGSCLPRVVGLLELSRGDAGLVLACPGPALAGVVVDIVGGEEQRERFYRRLAGGTAWSFFAMTEPTRGNDATGMQTRLEKADADGYRLHGTKRYIGNGARGAIGVVFARTGNSPLSIRAALVELPASGSHAEGLDMVGLRGAYLSELRFAGTPVAGAALLGTHLPASHRGMWGAIQTFHRMRIEVGAMALGTAYGMYDLVVECRPGAPGAETVAGRLAAARLLVYDAAAAVDHAPERGYLSSAAKLACTRLGVAVGRWAAAALGPASLLEHPLLEKWVRDVHAFEFMEGTSNIQRLHVAGAHLKGADGGPR